MADEEQAPAKSEEKKRLIKPEKIYIKDVSFETPTSPEIFLAEWLPEVKLLIDSNATSVEDDIYEVVLSVTVTVNLGERTAFLAEVHQAGLFTLVGLTPEQLHRNHHVFCLRFLHPYACAAITDLIAKGGFPQYIVPPVNFDRRYIKVFGDNEQSSKPETS